MKSHEYQVACISGLIATLVLGHVSVPDTAGFAVFCAIAVFLWLRMDQEFSNRPKQKEGTCVQFNAIPVASQSRVSEESPGTASRTTRELERTLAALQAELHTQLDVYKTEVAMFSEPRRKPDSGASFD